MVAHSGWTGGSSRTLEERRSSHAHELTIGTPQRITEGGLAFSLLSRNPRASCARNTRHEFLILIINMRLNIATIRTRPPTPSDASETRTFKPPSTAKKGNASNFKAITWLGYVLNLSCRQNTANTKENWTSQKVPNFLDVPLCPYPRGSLVT